MARIHSFPLFAVRPMYLSVKAFQKALNDVILSRRAIRNMNTLYPNATPEELASVDNVCIICREEMIGNGSAKKLPCNHIFHVSCLRSWFQRQQTCPTCRLNILNQSTTSQQQQNNQNANQQAPNGQQPNPQQPQAAAAAAAAANQPNANNQINANNFRILFGNLNFVDNFADYILQDRQQQQRPNQRNTNNATSSSATNQDANSAATTSAATATATPNRNTATRLTNALFQPPFMGFSFMPFLPFPIPPLSNASNTNTTNTNNTNSNVTADQTNLTQLSEEELRRLEGNERSALEARIRLLQNLRTSIDAIVLQFQQYNQLIVQDANESTTNNVNNNNTSSSTTNLSNNQDNKDENLKASTSKVKMEKREAEVTVNNLEKPTTSGPVKHAIKNSSNEIKDELNESSKELIKDKINGDNLEEESNLVRQLRLRRFNNQSSSENDGIKNEESKKE